MVGWCLGGSSDHQACRFNGLSCGPEVYLLNIMDLITLKKRRAVGHFYVWCNELLVLLVCA